MPDPEPSGESYEFQSVFSDAQSAAEPAVTPEPAASPPAASEPVSPPEPSAIARAASQAGFEVEGLSDEEIAQQMVDGYQQLRPYADWGRQIAPYADQIQEYFNRQQAAEAQPQKPPSEEQWTPESYFQSRWQEPKWEEQYDLAERMGIVQKNPETGLYEAAPGREAMALPLLSGMNQVLMARHQQWQKITSGNPYHHFYDVLLEPMQRAWQQDMSQYVEQYLKERDTRNQVNEFERKSDWLYQQDANGQRVMSDRGREFYATIDQLKRAGVTDPLSLLELATRMVGGPSPPAPPAAAPPSPAEVSEQKQASFLENAMAKAQHAPNAGGYVQESPGYDPVNVSETELQKMFVSDFRKAGVTG